MATSYLSFKDVSFPKRQHSAKHSERSVLVSLFYYINSENHIYTLVIVRILCITDPKSSSTSSWMSSSLSSLLSLCFNSSSSDARSLILLRKSWTARFVTWGSQQIPSSLRSFWLRHFTRFMLSALSVVIQNNFSVIPNFKWWISNRSSNWNSACP